MNNCLLDHTDSLFHTHSDTTVCNYHKIPSLCLSWVVLSFYPFPLTLYFFANLVAPLACTHSINFHLHLCGQCPVFLLLCFPFAKTNNNTMQVRNTFINKKKQYTTVKMNYVVHEFCNLYIVINTSCKPDFF